MSQTAPFVSSLMRVEPEWIDYNGHMNVAYYVVLFDRCVDEFFSLLDIGPDYVERENSSSFTVEGHITYQRELALDAPVKVNLQIVDFDEKRIHLYLEMYHSDEDFLSATWEQLTLHVDMAAKCASVFPTDVLEKIDKMYQAHQTLPLSPNIGRIIGIRKK
jgi:acyl-CoA thioester hydrolase